KSPIVHRNSTKLENSNQDRNLCISFGKATGLKGFSRGPFFRDDGGLLLAYDPMEHPDTLRDEDILVIERDLYTYSPDPNGQLYFVPKEKLPKEDNYRINFGYILKKDS